jgi:tripartite ATP-independent transporter DctM subunit
VIPLGIAFAVLILIGVPIAFALGLAGVVGMLAMNLNLITVPTRMFTGIDSFVLLAAPFYILAGDLMNRGGITDRLIRLAQIIIGRIRGGTAYANTMASIFFAGISGTAIADTAALGQIFIKGMPKEGYTKEFAAAVTVAGSVIGPIIPPSVIMVIFAAVSQVSLIQLFVAGIVPGLLLGAACAVVIFLYARGGHLPVSDVRVERAEVPRLARDGVLVLTLPLLIVGGTLSGAFTATEAGGVAVVYAAVLSWLVFRHLDPAGLWQALKDSARTTATLFILIAAATVVSYVLTIGGIAGYARGLGLFFEGEPVLFMLTVMAILLVVGCFLDPGAAIVLFVPLLMPVARAMGIDELQFSMVVILTLTLGLITPPVGVCLFVACRIGDIPVWRLVRAVAPFLLAEVVVVLLLVFFPVLASGLPGLLR